MTPVFGHGHLRLYLLKLLDESPRHGYELIQALSERFGGTYSPSAGTIYPRLAKLEDEGLVTKTSDGRKTVYEITDAGRAELATRESELSSIEDELTDSVRRLADEVRSGVNAAMRSLRADLASAAREARSAPQPHAAGTAGSGLHDDQLATRAELRDADIALAQFRHQVRTDLRSRGARSNIPAGTAARLTTSLAALRAELLASLDAKRDTP
jgi:DNA-binding PadR family transcriptional regulator